MLMTTLKFDMSNTNTLYLNNFLHYKFNHYFVILNVPTFIFVDQVFSLPGYSLDYLPLHSAPDRQHSQLGSRFLESIFSAPVFIFVSCVCCGFSNGNSLHLLDIQTSSESLHCIHHLLSTARTCVGFHISGKTT